jgi:hypothetical protein
MLKKAVYVILVLLLAIQLVPVEKTNPEESAPMQITDMKAKAVLDRACMDCHSNNTVWPWYASIAPISWKIEEHVVEGRDELNFSEWGTYSTKKAIHKLEEIVEEVEEGNMPEDGYVLIHKEAKITPEDLAVLKNWVSTEIAAIKPAAVDSASSL